MSCISLISSSIQVDCHQQLAKLLGDMKQPSILANDDNDNTPVEMAPRVSTEDCICVLVEVSSHD